MEMGRNLEHITERHQRGFKVPMEIHVPPGQRNVNYGCFDGQRKLDHTTERL